MKSVLVAAGQLKRKEPDVNGAESTFYDPYFDVLVHKFSLSFYNYRGHFAHPRYA